MRRAKMPIHEISQIFQRYIPSEVEVVNIRIGLRCSACGNEWGIKVNDEEELIRQVQKFICLPCYQKFIQEKSVRSEYYDHKESYNT